MFKRIFPLIASLGLLSVITLSVPVSPVHAQTPPANSSGQALEIGPPVISLSADPGQSVKATISIRDVSPTSLIVTNEINDFTASGEDGTPKIVLDGTVSPFSLKEWVTTLPELNLKPREIKTITLTINVPKSASPGGYYGVVRFTGTPPDISGSGVSLAASLGSLILLKVNGDAKESLTIAEFSANSGGKVMSLFETAPITFSARIKNDGNIQEEPSGLITIKDMFNNVTATLPVNQPPHDVLPDSIRRFDVPLDSSVIGNKILFGLYHADMKVTYGANKQVLTSSFSFWVIPYRIIGIGIVILIIAFFAFRFGIKRYNRSIVARATGVHPTKKRK
jgi:hypothetical protein